MARQKNKIFMFLFSLIPGAGQMYMGFMKQGLSLMTIFATLCAVGIWLDIKPLLFFAPIILLYSFFDATNKNSMDPEAFKKLEDHYLWGDDWMDWSESFKDSISRRDGKKAMGTVMYIVAACMIWSVVKYFADIIYGPTSLPGAVIAKIPVAVVAIFILWAGRKLMKSASDEEKRFYRGMPYPYAQSMGIHMNGERMPNPWERVWSDPQRVQHPEKEPVRETVVTEETAAAQEKTEKAKVELRKENAAKDAVKTQEENAEAAQESKTQTVAEEAKIIEENAESEKKTEITETVETVEAEDVVEEVKEAENAAEEAKES